MWLIVTVLPVQGKKKSMFYRPLDDHDDLEKMKERASKNHSFIYVKVTEVLLCVSYKVNTRA